MRGSEANGGQWLPLCFSATLNEIRKPYVELISKFKHIADSLGEEGGKEDNRNEEGERQTSEKSERESRKKRE